MRFWASVSLAAVFAVSTYGQTPAVAQTKPGVHRKFNELTLAGLRPGRDKAAKAIKLFGKPSFRSTDNRSLSWEIEGSDGAYSLNLDVDKSDVVQFIRVSHGDAHSGILSSKNSPFPISGWESGRGLAAGAKAARVVQLYGEPDSRSPSTKAGRKLELLYYAFDWAGAEVPQVMEVSCTVEEDGKPGRVEEITLAAPSL
jgi:hypothetical protein